MDRLRWLFINFLQALFTGAWSVLWMSTAIVGSVVLRSQRFALRLAHTRWAPGLLEMSGAKLDVQGLEKVNLDEPCVFVVNHQSMIDIPVLQRAIPVPLRFVLKAELMNVPFLGWYCRAVGMIPIDRGNTTEGIRRLQKTADLVTQQKAHVIAFVEGTRSRTGVIGSFKKGAFMLAMQAGVPVVPISIEGARHVLPSDGFSVRPGTIRVTFGDPIPTKDLGPHDRHALMLRAHQAVVEMNRAQGGLGDTPMAIDLSSRAASSAARASSRTSTPARMH